MVVHYLQLNKEHLEMLQRYPKMVKRHSKKGERHQEMAERLHFTILFRIYKRSCKGMLALYTNNKLKVRYAYCILY